MKSDVAVITHSPKNSLTTLCGEEIHPWTLIDGLMGNARCSDCQKAYRQVLKEREALRLLRRRK